MPTYFSTWVVLLLEFCGIGFVCLSRFLLALSCSLVLCIERGLIRLRLYSTSHPAPSHPSQPFWPFRLIYSWRRGWVSIVVLELNGIRFGVTMLLDLWRCSSISLWNPKTGKQQIHFRQILILLIMCEQLASPREARKQNVGRWPGN